MSALRDERPRRQDRGRRHGPERELILLRVAPLLLLSLVPLALAAPKAKKGELIWTRADLAQLGIESVALLPATAYDHDLQHQKQVEAAMGQSLRGTGYRWVSPTLARDMLRSAFHGDSVLRAVGESVLEHGRLDSVSAAPVCAALRTDAVLTVRIDLFERLEMEFDQAGKPSTTVQLKAALVDSLGRLLWSASGSETMEGPYHDPASGTIGVRGSGLGGAQPMTGQGGAPTHDEVIARLLARWTPNFPVHAAPAPAAARDSTPRER